jgi:hypothetical protein
LAAVTGRRETDHSYIVRVLISIDQLGNTICNGDPDETISSRVGRGAVAGKRWALMLEPIINWIMGSPTHCRDAIGV